MTTWLNKLNTISAKWRFSLWVLLFSVVAFYGLFLWQSGAKIQSDMLAMLPHYSQNQLAETALNQVEKRLADRVYIAVIADDKTTAIQSAKSIIDSLQNNPGHPFSDITSAGDTNYNQIGKWYFEHRFHLLTPTQQQSLLNDDIQTLILKTQQQLYSAFGVANSQLISQDPLLLFTDNLLALSPKGQLTVEQDILLNQHQGKVAAIISAKGRKSAFNPDGQQQQLAALNVAFSQVTDNKVTILKAGALFHAQAATASAKFEISLIGGCSLLGIMALVWLGFKSLVPLALALLTLTSGFVMAIVATLAIFTEIHLLTLVFGTSLIGIAIDYSFHFYCDKLNSPQNNAAQIIQRILPAMSLALLTSSLAFIGVGFTPFPGMQQVAVFCTAGLMGAYITLVLAFPLLANRPLKSTRTLTWSQAYLNLIERCANKPALLSSVILLMLLLLVFGLPQVTHNDDIRNLQQSPQAITDEENELRQWLNGGTDNQFILVSATSENQLIDNLHQLNPVLEQAISSKILNQYFSLAQLLPSHAEQQQNYQLQAKIYQNLPQIIDTLGLDNTSNAISRPLLVNYQYAKDHYLNIKDLLTISGNELSGLWVENTQNELGAIILLTGINNLPALKQLLTQTQLPVGQVQLIDKVGDISQLMGHYRQLTLYLLLAVLIIAGIIFCVKYPVKLAIAVIGVPSLAILLTLSSLGLSQSPLSLFHALALILILGIGIDYSLFFAEAKHSSRGVMMAIFMSACSTLLAFGLLALSQTHAIHFFGLTLLLGIGFTFLIAPFMTLISRKF
ncbi:MMPL family transporter [Shewanella aestuarii]|uniref:Transporter permease n=1 Tax=Shewanella aestuarii TaxID=1028752 RepID=A0A6G9QFX6_9GAMM|nr:transporter permease [Shewanella aestuarii]QIR13298.1 transporter permease [Shewanella aestuarii]